MSQINIFYVFFLTYTLLYMSWFILAPKARCSSIYSIIYHLLVGFTVLKLSVSYPKRLHFFFQYISGETLE